MTSTNKSYRINTKIGSKANDINLNLNLVQNYDILEILSLKISTENLYKLHTSGYGCVVGRVLANGGVGVPNAKISMFIEVDNNTVLDEVLYNLYPYKTTATKNGDNIRYNLLPDNQVSECHQVIGTFPNKRLVLDDNNVLEIFDKYYKYTTITNESGDYMLFGVPTGNQTFHIDIDLSDIGFLSQKPIDMLYKGYSSTMFENSKQFKIDTNIDNLIQVISQNKTVFVKPFWGEDGMGEIGITRSDIDVDYKFEPTCIFMGSIVSDEKSSGFSKKCTPMENMGRMDKLTTGNGTIEMIRKRIDGSIEDFPINGNELIDGNGVWCYQIPMNLDYVTTDEYGNLVPTDNVEIGLPTRTRVRFRVSLSDFESDTANNHLVKILVPNNPSAETDIDYAFGTYTKDDEDGTLSFRDLFWNNVYTTKAFIPRIQKGNTNRTSKFSGIKAVNVNNGNNPLPYNNMRVRITFMFTLQCAIIKSLIFFIKSYNWLIGLSFIGRKKRHCAYIGDGLCPDLEGWYFAPLCGQRSSDDDKDDGWRKKHRENTLVEIKDKDGGNSGILDEKSKDSTNNDETKICLTTNISYFMECLEINLALENNVIQFDFYNDWINGLLYIPRWFVNIRKKQSYLFGLIKIKPKVQACLEDSFSYTRRYTQQCALGYNNDSNGLYSNVTSPLGCKNNSKQKCHKKSGRKNIDIFGKKGGIVHSELTLKKQNVYYAKPNEWTEENKKCNLFATDIVLLGNINKCNLHGIPSDFDGMEPSTFQIPPSLVQTNMDSEGVLYGVKGKNGSTICDSSNLVDGVEKLPQTFESYDEWSKGMGLYDDKNLNVTEYAVSEMSGIDWGVSGPNQGDNDLGKLYFPGGHFLGISCTNSEVNIKSCVNLSRICELGTMMSQRQALPYFINNDNDIEVKYNFSIPTGLISKNEISDNNFRNIFATLNFNKLKTKINENGLREYEFSSYQPTNFNGELSNRIDNSVYNAIKPDNEVKNSKFNASAHTSTFEETSSDYYYYRFGLNGDEKHENKFLLKEEGKLYLPVYENSFYFYYGIKNGSTAIEKFLHDYYSLCPRRGIISEPEMNVKVTDKPICNLIKGIINVELKNVPVPYDIELLNSNNKVINSEKNKIVDKFTIYNIENGNYTLVLTNKLKGLTLKKDFVVKEVLPTGEEYNFNKDSYTINTIDYNERPIIYLNDNKIERTPMYNGGVISLTLPKLNWDAKPPYIYGFVVTSNNITLCHAFDSKLGAKSRVLRAVNRTIPAEHTFLNFTSEIVTEEYDKYSIPDNMIRILDNGDSYECSFNFWGERDDFSVYVCYTCSEVINNDSNFKLYLIGRDSLNILYEKFSYYLYDEDVLLSDIDKNSKYDIIEIVQSDLNHYDISFNNKTYKNRTGRLKYENLKYLSEYEEWAIKKALYFDGSYFNGDTGKINVGLVGGKMPYNIILKGNGEQITDSGVTVSEIFNTNNYQLDYDLNIDSFNVPTNINPEVITNESWLGSSDINTKLPYLYYAVDNKGCIPTMIVKKATYSNNDIPNNNSGNDMTSLIENA